MAGGGERMAQAPDDQAAHQARIAEPDLGLGRVDVDVDIGRVEFHIERGQRVAVAGQEVGVGGAHRIHHFINGPILREIAVCPGLD